MLLNKIKSNFFFSKYLKSILIDILFQKTNLYNDSKKIKVLFNKELKNYKYQLQSVKDFCLLENYLYKTVEKKQKREVFVPKFFGLEDESTKIAKIISPEIYLAELNNVEIVGANGIVLTDQYCLYDLATMDINNRYNLVFENVISFNNNKIVIQTNTTYEEIIEEGIFLVGFASFNYYHLTVELLSKLQHVDSIKHYRKIPLLIDEIVLDIPQYKRLLNLLNKHKHPVRVIKKGKKYKVKKLIYPSNNTWMPINLKNTTIFKDEDSLISRSAIEYVRKSILNDENETYGVKKIFISRKSTKNTRLINENEVLELFKLNGFEIVYPEMLSIDEQIQIFSEAKCVVGATGAAFTNILYCPKNAKIVCIIPKVYNFNIYSTIAGLLGIQTIFLDAEIVEKSIALSGEKYKVDLGECERLIKSMAD